MADPNLLLIAALERRGSLTPEQAAAERAKYLPAPTPKRDPLTQLREYADSLLAAGDITPQTHRASLAAMPRSRGAVNESPASPLDGMVAARPLVEAGLDPLDVDSEGQVKRERWAGKDPQTVLDEIALYNPDASQHLNNLLRLCLPGNLDITAYRVVGGKRTEQLDEDATQDLRDWALAPDRIGRIYGGSIQAIALVQLRTLITTGALAAELEPTKALDDIEDVYPVYPYAVEIDVRGSRVYWTYKPKQGPKVDLNPNQFIYLPLDPQLKQPHGVPLMLPALETHFMLTEVLRSFVRVARNHGWARLGVKVLYSVCYDAACQALGMSPDTPEDPEALYTYLKRYLTQIQTEYQRLDPDSAWIHWDWAEPDTIGADHSAQSIDPEKAVKAIEQVHITAIKALPTTLGRQYGNALSTAGSIEYKLYVQTAEALRGVLHTFLSWVCTQRLRLQGREAYAVVTQPEIRKDELAVEADAFLKRVTGYQLAVAAGFTDNEQAALDLFGKAPASPVALAPPAAAALAYEGLEGLRVTAAQRVSLEDVAASTDFYEYLRERASPSDRKALGILDAVQIGTPARMLRGLRADGDEDEGEGVWAYNRRTHRYRTPDGRYASSAQVRGYLDGYLADIERRNVEATQRLADGSLSKAKYLQEARERVQEAHITARAMAVGGRSVMGRADLAAIDVGYGRDIRALQKLAQQLEDGDITPAQAVARSQQIGQATVLRTYDIGAREVRSQDSWEEGRRVLTSGVEHCRTCLSEAADGWVPIDKLGAIGATDCGGNDKCSFDYRYRRGSASPERGQPFPTEQEYVAILQGQLAAGMFVRGIDILPPSTRTLQTLARSNGRGSAKVH